MKDIELTPAQLAFLKSSIAGFTVSKWPAQLAGQAGSQRCFIRISQPGPGKKQSWILVVWDSRDEDWPRFLGIVNEIGTKIPFLPKIFSRDDRHGLILEEDLGSATLKRYCHEDPSDLEKAEKIYRKVIDSLCKWQSLPASLSKTICSRSMDLETFLWETAYFASHCVTEFCGCENLLTREWDRERARFAAESSSLPRTCMHRDFQSENIMIHKGRVRFVDFQGARLGPPEYDAASLLFDPYMPQLDSGLSESLLDYYMSRRKIAGAVKKPDRAGRAYYLCAAQRLMQALGAYGNLSIHKGKIWYKEYVPVALKRLKKVLVNLPDFPYTAVITETCIAACLRMKNNVQLERAY